MAAARRAASAAHHAASAPCARHQKVGLRGLEEVRAYSSMVRLDLVEDRRKIKERVARVMMRTVSEYMIMPHLMLGLTPLRCATLVVTPQRQRYAAAHGLHR